MTVIFDGHDDENRERIRQLLKPDQKGALKLTRAELKYLSYDPLEKEFHHDFNERTGNGLHRHRTTYEIITRHVENSEERRRSKSYDYCNINN